MLEPKKFVDAAKTAVKESSRSNIEEDLEETYALAPNTNSYRCCCSSCTQFKPSTTYQPYLNTAPPATTTHSNECENGRRLENRYRGNPFLDGGPYDQTSYSDPDPNLESYQ
ncbi:MAG TPA: hypothetical protein VEL47_00790 [Myxococcota bacterium]|nr:hypothetical protein [Myxococcota bacterium]